MNQKEKRMAAHQGIQRTDGRPKQNWRTDMGAQTLDYVAGNGMEINIIVLAGSMEAPITLHARECPLGEQ